MVNNPPSSPFPLSWVDEWFPSVDGIRAKEFRDAVTGDTKADGIVTDHKTGASAELAPRAGDTAGERPSVATKKA